MTTSNLIRPILIYFILFLGSMETLSAADGKNAGKPKTKPAMLVTTAQVTEGTIRPTTEFIGTTYFARVSQVAADVEGLVQKVNFEVGDRVKQGASLAELDSELLDTSIVGTRAAFEQNLVDLKKVERDYKRIERLFKDQVLSEADYDTYLFKKNSLAKLSIVLESKLNALLIEKRKKNILAPFDGLVIKKSVEVGEWLSRGGQIAVIADNTKIDILVDVSPTLIDFLKRGRSAPVTLGNRKLTATFLTFIPRGDIATRTFTAKLRLNTADQILEGMEARIMLPRGGETHCLMVPRDAVVNKNGTYSIFIVDGGNAKNISVKVIDYMDLMAGISGPGLETGQSVIVKGSKRVRNGQPVKF